MSSRPAWPAAWDPAWESKEREKGRVIIYMNMCFWICTWNYIKTANLQASRKQIPMAHGSIFLLYFRLGISLQACLLQIVGYRNLIADVEKLRREPYDSDNPQHEEMLLKVSPSLMSVNDYQALRPGSLFALRIQSWGYEDMGAVTDCQGWVLLLVTGYFFIRKFIWEINFKASWLL